MSEAALTPDRILDAAEETLTRYGPAKTTVVDVARALGVSHGSVYRHFSSKAALRDAVTERWLARVSDPLATIAAEDTPGARAAAALVRSSSLPPSGGKMKIEPELFATYHAIFAESRDVIRAHVETLAGQIARIIADGIARGEFAAVDPAQHRPGDLLRHRPLPRPLARRRMERSRHRRGLRERLGADSARPHQPATAVGAEALHAR